MFAATLVAKHFHHFCSATLLTDPSNISEMHSVDVLLQHITIVPPLSKCIPFTMWDDSSGGSAFAAAAAAHVT